VTLSGTGHQVSHPYLSSLRWFSRPVLYAGNATPGVLRQSRSLIRRESSIQANSCRAAEFLLARVHRVHLVWSRRDSLSLPESARRAWLENHRNDRPRCVRQAVSVTDRTPGNPASDNAASMRVCIPARIQFLETARIEIPMPSRAGPENLRTTTASSFQEYPPGRRGPS